MYGSLAIESGDCIHTLEQSVMELQSMLSFVRIDNR